MVYFLFSLPEWNRRNQFNTCFLPPVWPQKSRHMGSICLGGSHQNHKIKLKTCRFLAVANRTMEGHPKEDTQKGKVNMSVRDVPQDPLSVAAIHRGFVVVVGLLQFT